MALACAAAPAIADAQSLTVRAAGDMLQVRGTGLRLIEGVVAEHLKDGRSVRVDFEMTILDKAPQGAAITRNRQSFILSFDLWEQRYAVTRAGATPRSISHLAARDAEAWCSKTCRSRSPRSDASPAISPSGSASSIASRMSRRLPPRPSRRSPCAR